VYRVLEAVDLYLAYATLISTFYYYYYYYSHRHNRTSIYIAAASIGNVKLCTFVIQRLTPRLSVTA